MVSAPMTMPRVESCMDSQTHAVRAEDDLYQVIKTLIDESVTGAIVVDTHGQPVGMITEAEGLKLLSEGAGGDVPRGKVGDFMCEVVSVKPNMDIYYTAGLFNANPTRRRFAVVDGSNKLIGVVTRKDILKLVHSQLMSSGG